MTLKALRKSTVDMPELSTGPAGRVRWVFLERRYHVLSSLPACLFLFFIAAF
jgi:hypothetical protein